jgi:alpha-tubulin suppressor-like RCC1 family protein
LSEPILLPGPVSSFAVSSVTDGRPPKDEIPGSPPPPPNVHACAVVGGSLHCGGKSERGGMCSGLPDVVLPLPTAAPIKNDGWAQQVSAGGETTCVRFTNGTVQCCGLNESAQLGTGAPGSFSPVLVYAVAVKHYVVSVSVAKQSACALAKDGRVSCWGSNGRGELGQGSTDALPHPTPMEVRVR